MTDFAEQVRKGLAMSAAGYGFSADIDDVAGLLDAYDELKGDVAKLSDPVVVHLNMLRGGIARPSWAQIQHLYPEEFAALNERIRKSESDKKLAGCNHWPGQKRCGVCGMGKVSITSQHGGDS